MHGEHGPVDWDAPPLASPSRASGRALLRVPAITGLFWIIKGLSTALGESTSDFLVHTLQPVPAVLLGLIGFTGALALQLSMHRYSAVTYWLAVVMVGIFGTMGADVMHVGFGVPYAVSTVLCAVAFWFAYVMTRPLGASFADWLGKPVNAGGLGVGSGPVTVVLALVIAVFVAYAAITRCEVQEARTNSSRG
jgi:uncharacterized membrane-anchored protein